MSKTNGKANGRKNGNPQSRDKSGNGEAIQRRGDGTFLKGFTANPGGKPRAATQMRDMVLRLLEEQGEDGIPQAEKLMRAVIQRAIEGDDHAAKLILDRVWPATLQVDANVTGMASTQALAVFDLMAADYAKAGRLPELTDRG